MAEFFTRVELHQANGSDYETLHAEMLKREFYRAIVGGSGDEFKLPTAEYHSIQSLTCEGVRDLAGQAATVTGRKHWILTVEANTWALRSERTV